MAPFTPLFQMVFGDSMAGVSCMATIMQGSLASRRPTGVMTHNATRRMESLIGVILSEQDGVV
jgi:hypothetical protein